ncbi:MAG: benzoyl-CoA 2,3-epoxidase subunit BoxA [Arenicellales bacterium]
MDAVETLKQHVIDPEICIRCNTCEDTCPIDAVTHDDTNYVVDATLCNHCMDCVAPCPTGAIDNWRMVPTARAYSLEDQFSWEALPDEGDLESVDGTHVDGAAGLDSLVVAPEAFSATQTSIPESSQASASRRLNATLPPWSAAHPYTNLYGPKANEPFITAKVTGNFRVTEAGTQYDTHHIVLDFGSRSFPVLEGQSIGILPPGLSAAGKPHHARQYSVASPRNGERPGYNNVSLTIKRVLEDHNGNPTHGVASNYLCDLQVGDDVQVVGPFGISFLMPNHPHSNIVMICTGTGSAPMRAMTEWRRRLAKSGKFDGGKLMLFFGARTPQELPYFGPLQNLPSEFIDAHFAFSRVEGQPKKYVQDVMREQAQHLAPLMQDADTYFYVCGLKAMEAGVLDAMSDICSLNDLNWDAVGADLQRQNRLHFETY